MTEVWAGLREHMGCEVPSNIGSGEPLPPGLKGREKLLEPEKESSSSPTPQPPRSYGVQESRTHRNPRWQEEARPSTPLLGPLAIPLEARAGEQSGEEGREAKAQRAGGF